MTNLSRIRVVVLGSNGVGKSGQSHLLYAFLLPLISALSNFCAKLVFLDKMAYFFLILYF